MRKQNSNVSNDKEERKKAQKYVLSLDIEILKPRNSLIACP